jgi:hypothetical protein
MERAVSNPLLLLFILLFPLTASAQSPIDRESVVQYVLEKPDIVSRGKEFDVSVLFSVQPQWYIYAPTGVNAAQGMIETQVVFILPPGLSRVGKIKLPETTFKNGHEIYEGKNIAMTQTIRVPSDLSPGIYEIKGKVIWQTCNSDICLPPISDKISMTITVN